MCVSCARHNHSQFISEIYHGCTNVVLRFSCGARTHQTTVNSISTYVIYAFLFQYPYPYYYTRARHSHHLQFNEQWHTKCAHHPAQHITSHLITLYLITHILVGNYHHIHIYTYINDMYMSRVSKFYSTKYVYVWRILFFFLLLRIFFVLTIIIIIIYPVSLESLILVCACDPELHDRKLCALSTQVHTQPHKLYSPNKNERRVSNANSNLNEYVRENKKNHESEYKQSAHQPMFKWFWDFSFHFIFIICIFIARATFKLPRTKLRK